MLHDHGFVVAGADLAPEDPAELPALGQGTPEDGALELAVCGDLAGQDELFEKQLQLR